MGAASGGGRWRLFLTVTAHHLRSHCVLQEHFCPSGSGACFPSSCIAEHFEYSVDASVLPFRDPNPVVFLSLGHDRAFFKSARKGWAKLASAVLAPTIPQAHRTAHSNIQRLAGLFRIASARAISVASHDDPLAVNAVGHHANVVRVQLGAILWATGHSIFCYQSFEVCIFCNQFS